MTSPLAAPLRPGDLEQVGPYRLTGRLGEGGQGSVFLAEDEPGHSVAVKLLHARFTGDAKARSRFAAELAVARRVTPFCTARILDADVDGRTPYIVSEFIDGPSLSAVLAAEGPRSGPALIRIAVGTITALAAIHEAGVVHRDFKPSNVLMAPDGPRVIDFGIARALDATGTLSSTAVGTPAYMAPEQISGAPVGPEADIFAWGASMVYASTARAPFGADSIPAVMHRILNLPPDLGALPEPLRGIVGYCLIKDPSQRPSAQQVLLQLLGHSGADPEAGAQPSTMFTQGAEIAAAQTPTPAPQPAATWPPAAPAARGWVPPPGPAPYGQEQTFPAGAVPNGGPRRARKGIGVLAGSAAAAVVALILIGAFVVVELTRKDDKKTGTASGQGRTGGEFRMASLPPSNLDPSNGSWGADRTIAKQLFTGLVEVGTDGSVTNRLAASVQPGEGCRTWTIQIRSGTTFSNGEPVDAQAVMRGWTRSAQSKLATAITFMGDIEGYREVSNSGASFGDRLKPLGGGFQLRLTAPDCDFAKRLGDPVFFPVPSAAGKADNAAYNDLPIGNGPFKIGSYVKSQRLELIRNDAWGFGKAKLDRVTLDLSGSDPQRAIAGVRSGSLDWAQVTAENAATARAAGGAQLLTRVSTGSNHLVPITDRGPLKSKEARLAVSYALDRKALTNANSAGIYPPSTGLVPQGVPGYKRSGTCPSCETHDPAKAKELAQQAGLKPGTQLRLLVREGSTYARWGAIVKEQLERTLGLKVVLVTQPTTEYTSALGAKDSADMIALGWLPDYPSALSFLAPLLGGDQLPPNGSNYGRWRSSDFDNAIRAARTAQDPQSALSSLQTAEKGALDDMALIPIWNLVDMRLASKRFVNLQIDIDGDPTLATAALR